MTRYSGSGSPNLDCFEPGGYPPKVNSGEGDTSLVTLKGVVRAFSSGCDLKGVTIEVHKVARTGDPATDGNIGELVGTAHTTTASSREVLEENEDCVGNGERVVNREFSYPNVPMNTELMVLTRGQGWRELHTYNLFITEGDPNLNAQTDEYTTDVQAMMDADYTLFPMVALGAPIAEGNGALVGEVHDCENVRLQNAVVETSGSRRAVLYFNDNEENPMPENGRLRTGETSIFAALDARPGFHRLTAIGLVEEDAQSIPVTLGYYDVRVFPDAVTQVTLRGLRPHQVP